MNHRECADPAKVTTNVDTPAPILLPARAKVSLQRDRAAGGKLGGRSRVFGEQAKAASALEMLAKGKSHRQVALATGAAQSTVTRLAQDHESLIREWQEKIRETLTEKVLDRSEEWTRALIDSASDSDNRGQAQCAKVMLEATGVLSGGAVNVHVGDVHQSLTINSDSAIDYDADEYARMRDSMGL